jgi:hypothetical protein
VSVCALCAPPPRHPILPAVGEQELGVRAVRLWAYPGADPGHHDHLRHAVVLRPRGGSWWVWVSCRRVLYPRVPVIAYVLLSMSAPASVPVCTSLHLSMPVPVRLLSVLGTQVLSGADRSYTTAVDCYGFGVVISEMLCRTMPFAGHVTNFKAIVERHMRPGLPDTTLENLRNCQQSRGGSVLSPPPPPSSRAGVGRSCPLPPVTYPRGPHLAPVCCMFSCLVVCAVQTDMRVLCCCPLGPLPQVKPRAPLSSSPRRLTKSRCRRKATRPPPTKSCWSCAALLGDATTPRPVCWLRG